MIRYYIVDGTNTALRYTTDTVTIEIWKNGKWVEAPIEYHGIFSDDVPIEPIEVGDDTWKELELEE